MPISYEHGGATMAASMLEILLIEQTLPQRVNVIWLLSSGNPDPASNT